MYYNQHKKTRIVSYSCKVVLYSPYTLHAHSVVQTRNAYCYTCVVKTGYRVIVHTVTVFNVPLDFYVLHLHGMVLLQCFLYDTSNISFAGITACCLRREGIILVQTIIDSKVYNIT